MKRQSLEKKRFEHNMLDGDSVEDCGRAMLSAESVWEYISERIKEVEHEAYAKGYEEGLRKQGL